MLVCHVKFYLRWSDTGTSEGLYGYQIPHGSLQNPDTTAVVAREARSVKTPEVKYERCSGHRVSYCRSSINICSMRRPQVTRSQPRRVGRGLGSEVSPSDLPPGAGILSKGVWQMLPERGSELTNCRESFSWLSISTYWGVFLTRTEICPAGTSTIGSCLALSNIIQPRPLPQSTRAGGLQWR